MMKKVVFIPIFLIGLFLLSGTMETSAQKISKKGYASINERIAHDVVFTLADDAFEGRDAGLEGADRAAEYIVSFIKEWGVEPFGDMDYYQSFDAAKNINNWVTEADLPLDGLIASGCEKRVMKNILACIPGKGEGYVVVGAHYDHLGIDSSLVDDVCFNGADDNATGVSAVLQLAMAMKKSKKQPLRTIIFAFWDGEEKGLLGSRYFVKTTSILPDIAVYMNFDMIGRDNADNPGNVNFLYSADNPLFEEWMHSDVEKYKLDIVPTYKASKNLIGGSDNTPFARKGIPIVWYHTDGHPDYHRPTDTADKIDYKKLVEITRAAYLCLWRLANETSY